MADENVVQEDTNDDSDYVPEEVQEVVELANQFKDQIKRLRETRLDLVGRARKNELGMPEVVGETMDELLGLASQMAALAKATATACDAAFAFTESVMPDEEGDADAESIISKTDAAYIGSALSRSRVFLMALSDKVNSATTVDEIKAFLATDINTLAQEIDLAAARLTQIEEGSVSQPSDTN